MFQNSRAINYIQYLRALSVLLVFFYHLKLDFFKNGYLGVDIFFVISGYVITARLYRDYIENGNISISNFFLRRFKRIYPVLFFFLFTILIIIILISPSEYFLSRLNTIFFSLFGLSNIYYLLSNKDYFDTVFDDPLNHTWSLGVEEQFYLIFPIIFVSLIFFFKKNFKTINILFIIIILIGIYLTFINQENLKLVFYSPIFRFWQFLLGTIVFLISLNISYKKKFLTYISFIILILIIFNGNYLNNFQMVLFSSIFSSILIYLCKDEFLTKNKLINRCIIYLGDISYSFYLWHLPIIYFFNLYFDKNILSLIGIFFTSLFLSSFSYHYIEQKFRYFKFKNFFYKKIFLYGITFSFLVSLITILVIINDDLIKKNLRKDLKKIVYKVNYLERELDYSERSLFYKFSINNYPIYKHCTQKTQNFTTNDFGLRKECLKNIKKNKLFFIVGNSHTANFIPMFNNLNNEVNFYYLHYLLGSKPNFLYEISNALNEYNEVIFVTNVSNQEYLKFFFDSIDKLEKDIIGLVLGPIPNASNFEKPLECFIKQKNCIFNTDEDKNQRKLSKLYNDINENINNRKRKIYFYKPYNHLCPNKKCFSYNLSKDILTHRDDGHLTKEGSVLLTNSFKKFIKNIL